MAKAGPAVRSTRVKTQRFCFVVVVVVVLGTTKSGRTGEETGRWEGLICDGIVYVILVSIVRGTWIGGSKYIIKC